MARPRIRGIPTLLLRETTVKREQKVSWINILEASWKPIAAIAVPIAVAVSPIIYKNSIFDREVDSIIAEQALQLLRSDPDIDGDDEVSDAEKGVRDWAIDVIERYAQLSFPSGAKDLLRENATVPEGSNLSSWEGMLQNRTSCEPKDLGDFVFSDRALENTMISLARREAVDGISETCAPGKILEYFRVSTPWFSASPTDDWAAVFVGWLLSESGNASMLPQLGPGVRHLWWGAQDKGATEVDFGDLKIGDLIVWVRTNRNGYVGETLAERVRARNETEWSGHVALVVGLSDDRIQYIGGNQGNAVTFSSIARSASPQLGSLFPVGFIRIEQ